MAIIKVGDDEYLLTDHAAARMRIRKISEQDVIETIEEGELEYTEEGNPIYLKKIDKRKIAVVIVEGTERIKTVFEV